MHRSFCRPRGIRTYGAYRYLSTYSNPLTATRTYLSLAEPCKPRDRDCIILRREELAASFSGLASSSCFQKGPLPVGASVIGSTQIHHTLLHYCVLCVIGESTIWPLAPNSGFVMLPTSSSSSLSTPSVPSRSLSPTQYIPGRSAAPFYNPLFTK